MRTTHPIITKAFSICMAFWKSATCHINCPSVGNFTACRARTALDFFHYSLTYQYPNSLFPQNKCFISLKTNSTYRWFGTNCTEQNMCRNLSINQYLLIDEMKENSSGHVRLASVHDYKLNIPPMALKTSNKELLFTWDVQPGSGKGQELSLSQGYLHRKVNSRIRLQRLQQLLTQSQSPPVETK